MNRGSGWDKGFPTGTNLEELIPERYRNDFKDYLDRMKTRGRDEGTIAVLTADGREVVLDYSTVLVRDEEGNPLFVQGSARDITDRVEAEREKRKLEDQLNQAQKMESVGRLAGGIAHNFNNILMGIQGRVSLMLEDKAPSHQDYEHLRSIEEYIRNAAELTKDLLGFARGGKYEVRPTNLNLLIKHENEMFSRTHTSYAPWIIVKANDKKQARLESMRHVLSTLEYPGRENPGTHLSPDPDVVLRYHRSQLSID